MRETGGMREIETKNGREVAAGRGLAINPFPARVQLLSDRVGVLTVLLGDATTTTTILGSSAF